MAYVKLLSQHLLGKAYKTKRTLCQDSHFLAGRKVAANKVTKVYKTEFMCWKFGSGLTTHILTYCYIKRGSVVG
jgi:hypothetical protein